MTREPGTVDGCPVLASARLESGACVVLLHRADGRFLTARLENGSPREVHKHQHRDAAVDDFHARAGLLYKAR